MHISDEKLKSILKEAGVIDDENFDAAAREANESGHTVAETLIARGDVPEHYLAELLANYLKVPLVSLEGKSIDKDTLELVPENYAHSKQLVIFEYKKGEFAKAAMLDPLDYDALEYLRAKIGVDIQPHLTTKTSLGSGLKQYKERIGTEFSQIIRENIEKSAALSGETDLAKMAAAVPIVEILKSIIEYAISLNASDIHFEPFFNNLIVRYRVDGVLREAFDLPKQVEPTLVARVKILASLQIDEHRVPQDGRFKFSISEKETIDIRVNIIPVLYGEKAEMRLLRSTARPIALEDIGFPKEAAAAVNDEIKKPHGMILVTGPTGSGKTTTLYAILNILNRPEVNITTIEDPVEYEVQGVNQTQVNVKAGVTFEVGLRSLLRQDPNVIMVGEIRDAETVAIAIQAALTGHLLLSTLHTNDAPSALPRLLDMGAPAFLLASTVNLAIAQRLVRKICLACIETYELTETTKRLAMAQFSLLGHPITTEGLPKTLYRGKGCKVCGGTGYHGQIGIFELMRMSDSLREMVIRMAPSGELREQAVKEGMKTLFEDGLDKARRGVTTLDEVLRVIQE